MFFDRSGSWTGVAMLSGREALAESLHLWLAAAARKAKLSYLEVGGQLHLANGYGSNFREGQDPFSNAPAVF
jgi:hypothetical protein